MKKISLLKKISLFLLYRKLVLKNQDALEQNFSARVDRAYRIYTVINLPAEQIEEPYNLRKQDIDNFAQSYLKEYSSRLSKFLNERGLVELYDFYEIKKVEKYSYLVIYGFSLFDSRKFLSNLLYIYLPIGLGVISLIWIFLKWS